MREKKAVDLRWGKLHFSMDVCLLVKGNFSCNRAVKLDPGAYSMIMKQVFLDVSM